MIGGVYVARRSTPWHGLRRSYSLKANEATGAVTVIVAIALAYVASVAGRTARVTFVHDGHYTCTCMQIHQQ